jgi:monoamine oxidase
MGTEKDPEGMSNYAYFRGKHLRIGDFSNPEKVPFNLSWSERGKTPDKLLGHVLNLLVPDWQVRKRSLDLWSEVRVFGKSLWEYGFWNLLYRVLSPEAFFFVKYGSGYDSNVSNGNAVVLLPTGADYSSKNVYNTLTEGMDILPKTLASRFEENASRFEKKKKQKVRKNHRLSSIVRMKNGNYSLQFFLTKTENARTTDTADQKKEFEVKQVILAMPRAALERIEWDQWKKDEWLKSNLGSVLIQEAFKMFIAYEYAWWKSLGLTSGRSLSDLPLRQTFYFDSEDTDARQSSRKKAVLMASYSDIDSVPFWKGLEKEEKKGKSNSFAGPQGYKATNLMVREAHEQVKQIHGQREIPNPYAAAYYDWGNDTIFGGGWHCWKAGYDYRTIMKKMIKPVESENVYICGEAYSAEQGWCEGALETAELLLTEKLGVEPFIKKDWKPDLMKRTSYRF